MLFDRSCWCCVFNQHPDIGKVCSCRFFELCVYVSGRTLCEGYDSRSCRFRLVWIILAIQTTFRRFCSSVSSERNTRQLDCFGSPVLPFFRIGIEDRDHSFCRLLVSQIIWHLINMTINSSDSPLFRRSAEMLATPIVDFLASTSFRVVMPPWFLCSSSTLLFLGLWHWCTYRGRMHYLLLSSPVSSIRTKRATVVSDNCIPAHGCGTQYIIVNLFSMSKTA